VSVIPPRSAAVTLGRVAVLLLALAVAAGVRPAAAQTGFPNIPVWSYPGAWHPDARGDTIEARPRTISVRWLRDPVAEARPDFAGYRIYRGTNIGSICDTTSMMLLRRFSKQVGDSLFAWHFPTIDGSTMESDRIVTFIDPDSAGLFVKVRRPLTDRCRPRCYDSVMVLIPPPGPHDGFRTWYSITYETRNTNFNDYLDMFVPGPIVARTDLDVGQGPVAAAAADLDVDGLVDLVTANETANTVSIRLARADESCRSAGFEPRRDFPTGVGPRSLAVGDVDQDGWPDLLVANGTSQTLSVLLGTGQGELALAVDSTLGGRPAAIALADLNGEGQLDLVVANSFENSVSVRLGNGDGTFGPGAEIATAIRPAAIALGDLNNDRRLDLVVVSALDGAVEWRLGKGDGTFCTDGDAPPCAHGMSPTGPGVRAVTIADLGDDGKAELIVANGLTNTVTLLPGNGDGTFGVPVSFPVGVAPASIGVLDLNADARPDLAVADAGDGSVSFLYNATVLDTIHTTVFRDLQCRQPGIFACDSSSIVQGTLDFPTRTNMPLGGHPVFLIRGDFNREGVFDLAVVDSSADSAKVIFGPSNLNHKAANVSNDVWEPSLSPDSPPDARFFAHPVEATGGPTQNLLRVGVVPNPYRAVEAWNPAGDHEVHFINLPAKARIRIYTLAGDLVRDIQHEINDRTSTPPQPWDQMRDFESWDLKNASGRDVSSGIYIYRVEAGSFFHQSRFVVIR
jgi:hypothetical protein